jgi:predicted dehydrogenase
MLAKEDKPDIVCVVNANEDHAPATIKALEADCHVYLEKPMAPTLAQSATIIEAEARSRGTVQVGFEYIHGTMTSRVKQLIAEGYFGEVLWASVLDSRGHWWAESPDISREKIWKLDRQRGGGIIFHCGIHQLDIIRHYLGPIDEITAFSPPRNPLAFYPADVPGNVTLMLRARSGAVCNFQIFHDRAVTWYREANYRPTYHEAPGHEFNISLVGSKASCYMRIYDEVLHLIKLDQKRKENQFDRTEVFRPNPPDKSHHDMHALLMRFVRSVANGGGAIDPATDALETMRIAYAAEDAVIRGTTVKVKDYR